MHGPSAASDSSAVPRSAPSGVPPFRVLVVPGDGIGREVIPAAVRVLEATGLPITFVPAEAGWDCFERHGTSLPEATQAAAREADAILFGAVASPSHPVAGYRSPIVALRRELDLYANIRPVRTEDRGSKIEDSSLAAQHKLSSILDPLSSDRSSVVDLVVVRENTEGLYAGQESSDGETAVAKRVITRRASERIARAAFELARSRQWSVVSGPLSVPTAAEPLTTGNGQRTRPRVTIVHKANVLRETCGLFRAVALEVAAQYPDVAADELLVDTAALQLVQRPERFDVIVTTNLFGDILSDVASFWGGGLGLATSANVGERQALFEPVHGAAPDIAGRGIANPLAAIGCAAMLLEYLGRPPENQEPRTKNQEQNAAREGERGRGGEEETGGRGQLTTDNGQRTTDNGQVWAGRIRAAVEATLASGVRTPDLGGTARTEDVTRAVIDAMTSLP